MDASPPSIANAILQTAINVWQAFIVPTAVGLFALYKLRSGNSNSKQITDAERQQKFMDRLQDRIATQDKENAELRAYISRMEHEYEERLEEERYDKMRGWNLCRYWFAFAQDMRHDFLNYLSGKKEVEWTAPKIGPMEAPEPRKEKDKR